MITVCPYDKGARTVPLTGQTCDSLSPQKTKDSNKLQNF